MADSSGHGHPTGGRRRKYKSPAASSAASLPLPRLPDHLVGGLSDNEKENEVKRPRSTSPHLRLEEEWIQISMIVCWGSTQFGDGELTDTENPFRRSR